MKEQRERLSDLLYDVEWDYDEYTESCHDDGIPVTEAFGDFAADSLLQSGVLCPPCKIGDELWWACDSEDTKLFDGDPDVGVYQCDKRIEMIAWNGKEFGVIMDGEFLPFGSQYACLTRKDAEKYLKGESEQ